jgi:uncharacterized membrane protein (Fun14 family)
MKELLYDVNTGFIALGLMLAMAVAIELGYRYGRRHAHEANEATRTHVNTIQASTLGILALLLGFTFSLALQRYDSRSEALVNEANAIGTAYLRAQLLPPAVRGDAQQRLQQYTGLRVQAGAASLVSDAERSALAARSNEVLDALWRDARRAAESDPNPVTTGLFIQALNDAIDAYGRHDAALARHVPELILFLLFATFLVTGGIVGYAAGLAGHSPSSAAYILAALIVVLAFVIIDLDRPRRGFIQVDQASLVNLKTAIDADQSAVAQRPVPPDAPRPAVTGRR